MTATEALPAAMPFEQAMAMLGRTVTCPDGTDRRVTQTGGSGSQGYPGHRYHVGFDDGSWWSSEHGFETTEQRKAREWMAEWNAIKADERALITAVFGDVTARPLHTLKRPGKLIDAAKVKLVKARKIEPVTCGRCGGCGRYSYNQMDGDRCYGCGGTGKRPPSTRDALRAALRCD